MNPSLVPVRLSPIDEKRFGIRVARSNAVTLESLPTIIEFCHQQKVSLLIARCPAKDIAVVHQLEKNGFLLMDTLVYYLRDLIDIPSPPATSLVHIRPAHPDEADSVREIAAKAFASYFGHYHADSRLNPKLCDETYADWAYQSCLSKETAAEVLVAETGGKLIGFLTLGWENPTVGEGVLFGVDPNAQGLGVGKSLMIAAMHWFLSRNAKQMIISTQIVNLASQTVWTRLGFSLHRAYYTFHKWFD